jgi:hypothetical protein
MEFNIENLFFVTMIVCFVIALWGWSQQKPTDAPPTNPEMVCPHCQVKGKIVTSPGIIKGGISGGKATAAILTGGVSLLATGLSRKDSVTNCHCFNCGSNWTF